ncbi:MAG: phosphoenolpyruvate carboxylase [Gammaproteobacteria bacterium]|nr:phosphoenolpyruvate carboxylase [Gammaproteobacteria bacterium]
MPPQSGRRRHPASLPADKRRNIRFSKTEAPLRQDVHQLGGLIGAMIQDRGGAELFEAVESARSLAIARRDGVAGSPDRLEHLLAGLDDSRAQEVSRAFATWFQAINTAEQLHRVRRRRAYLYDASRPQRGGPEAVFQQLRKGGTDLSAAVEILNSIRLHPVFTGHPTEPTPTAVLRQQREIASNLEELKKSAAGPRQVDALLRSMQQKITAIWHCEEHPHEETTIAAELQQLLYFVTEVIYPALPDFYDSLTEAMAIAFGEEARDAHIGSLLRFHSAIGGDLEADVEITPRFIRQLFDWQRLAVLNLYRKDCLQLAETLTHSARRIDAGAEIRRRIRVYREHFPDIYAELGPDQRDMPFRLLLLLMAARLEATASDSAFHYDYKHELLDDLEVLADSLIESGGIFAGSQGVQRLIRRVETFGFHLLSVEFRQRAVVLRRVLGKTFDARQWESSAGRLKCLRQALEQDLGRPENLDNEGLRALAVFDSLRYLRGRYGRKALGGLLLGGVKEPADVLGALLLSRWAGFERADGHTPLDLIPVFESDMGGRQCARVIGQLLEEPAYRQHLEKRNRRQFLMVDHARSRLVFDLPSEQWSIRGLQKAAVDAVSESGTTAILLQARGSAYERSGRRSLLADIPPEQLQQPFRYAEAGERAGLRYGMQGIALRSLELAAGELLLAKARRGATEVPRGAEDLLECLAKSSARAHSEFPGGARGMADYFELATPADLLARMPTTARRSGMREGTAVELPRPLVTFCWAQSRNLLPGWYGFGAGFVDAVEKFGLKFICRLARDWPYLQSMLRDLELALARSDLEIAEGYSRLAGELHESCFNAIQEEHERTLDGLLNTLGQKVLLEDQPALRRSIRLRNPYVDPMNLLQVRLLSRWRASGRVCSGELYAALKSTVYGIARGVQEAT